MLTFYIKIQLNEQKGEVMVHLKSPAGWTSVAHNWTSDLIKCYLEGGFALLKPSGLWARGWSDSVRCCDQNKINMGLRHRASWHGLLWRTSEGQAAWKWHQVKQLDRSWPASTFLLVRPAPNTNLHLLPRLTNTHTHHKTWNMIVTNMCCQSGGFRWSSIKIQLNYKNQTLQIEQASDILPGQYIHLWIYGP